MMTLGYRRFGVHYHLSHVWLKDRSLNRLNKATKPMTAHHRAVLWKNGTMNKCTIPFGLIWPCMPGCRMTIRRFLLRPMPTVTTVTLVDTTRYVLGTMHVALPVAYFACFFLPPCLLVIIDAFRIRPATIISYPSPEGRYRGRSVSSFQFHTFERRAQSFDSFSYSSIH